MNKLAAFFGFEEPLSPLAQIIGPLFLILAMLLTAKVPAAFNYDLLFVAICGLFLTAKWKTRGLVAAVLLLAFSAGAKHVLFPHHHAWQAGLEGAIGLALFISALVFEEGSKWVFTQQSEVERNEKTILFLEEDLSQQKELAAVEAAAALEKLDAMRLQFEESNSEIFTLQVLNDVFRKSTAKSIEEKEAAISQARQFTRKEGQLLEEIDSLQKELIRLANESALAQQNKQLFEELNEARVQKEQTHLINDTTQRLARDLEKQLQNANARLEELNEMTRHSAKDLETKLMEMERQLQEASFDKANADARLEELSMQLEAVRSLQVEPEQQVLSSEEKEQLTLQIEAYQTRLEKYMHMEQLFRQLKAQFEEKNQILHQTRKELFQSDTELQTIKQKLQEKDLESNPISKEIHLEIDAIEGENRLLGQENEALQELVTHLMQQQQEVKKKIKKSTLLFEQSSLF